MTSETFAEALARATRELDDALPVDELLQVAAVSAREAIPGVDEAGISIALRTGEIRTVSATSDAVRQVDQLQYECGEGPCLDAMNGVGETMTNDLERDDRWPKFSPGAVAIGFRSQMGVQLYAIPSEVAGLNLYARSPGVFDRSSLFIAQLFAQYAASALGHARTIDQLNRSISSRQTVGQAIGIVMERYRLDEDRAFGFLRRVSSTTNTKLRDVATRLVTEANDAARSDDHPVPKPGRRPPEGRRPSRDQ